MITLQETQNEIIADPGHWSVYLMDFVDDFRYYRDLQAIEQSITLTGDRMDALLAATAETLCKEMDLEAPDWLTRVPPCEIPWFVAGLENLKAIALAESPLPYRWRKIFVTAGFLSRV
jgi:hypothetical protein